MFSAKRKAYIVASCEQSFKRRALAAQDVLSLYGDNISKADAIVERVDKIGGYIVTYDDSEYPDALRNIYAPPPVLYAKGDISLLKSESIAVVGSRRPTRYGRDVTTKFARALAVNGLTVVSGLARGIDTIAHTVTLENGGKTIAVIANGLDRVYPPENERLMREIEDKGLVISEYPPATLPLGFRFPERNRIISGLARGVLVTEAGRNSGSLITADYALEQGKELFLVPGSIFSPMSEGCNERLKECGTPVTDIGDLISGSTACETKAKLAVQLSFEQQSILDMLKDGEMHFTQLIDKCNIKTDELTVLLSEMELYGLIERTSGNYYCIANG
ncbi:MAG: DNA-processing protein DprA [Clostridia bacterium]|nr:DNA-processing protein DprA [Clostridia bacterium]